jgi:hypothetical protein
MRDASFVRRSLFEVTQSGHFSNAMLFVIFLNTVVLALQTEEAINRENGTMKSVINPRILLCCTRSNIPWGLLFGNVYENDCLGKRLL